jgi:hypothetical protein
VKVNIEIANPALITIFKNQNIPIFVDTNLFIPPDRSKLGGIPISFKEYKLFWLDALFDSFTNLSIHESVYKELVQTDIISYIDEKINSNPKLLTIHYDKDLEGIEGQMLLTYLKSISKYSAYDLERDSKRDRAEVRSLAFMAVREFVYFASNDDLPRRLIEYAEKLKTGLDNLRLLSFYDIIYFLYKKNCYDNSKLRMLYKTLYFLTNFERKNNPNWDTFIKGMDKLYISNITYL